MIIVGSTKIMLPQSSLENSQLAGFLEGHHMVFRHQSGLTAQLLREA